MLKTLPARVIAASYSVFNAPEAFSGSMMLMNAIAPMSIPQSPEPIPAANPRRSAAFTANSATGDKAATVSYLAILRDRLLILKRYCDEYDNQTLFQRLSWIRVYRHVERRFRASTNQQRAT